MDIFEKKSYLIGITNRILIGHPASKANCVLNIDTGALDLELPGHIKAALKPSEYEKKFIKNLLNKVTFGNDEDWHGNESMGWEGSDDFIRAEFFKYTREMLCDLSFVRERLRRPLEKIQSDPESDENSYEMKSSGEKYANMSPGGKISRRYKKYLNKYKKKFLYQWSNCVSF